MNISEQTNEELCRLLGSKLRQARLQQDLTQEQLAELTSLSISTIKGLEMGNGRIMSLITVMRGLGEEDIVSSLVANPASAVSSGRHKLPKTKRRASGKTGVPGMD